MSRILFTNNKEKFGLLHESFKKSGFEASFTMYDKIQEVFFASYKKLALDNENCYVEYDDDKKVSFICVGIGTLFFDGKLGEQKVLKELGRAYKEGKSVQELKRRCKGCFCVYIYDAIQKKGIIYVDDYNLFNCYYLLKDDGEFIITNTYWHIASAYKANMDLLKTYEYAHTFTILDNGTPYENIYRLADDEYIDLRDDKIFIKKIVLTERERSWKDRTYEEILDCLVNGIRENASIVKNNFEEASICVTGGTDSRTTVAALYGEKLKLQLVYWVGNSIMTGTEEKDRHIVEQMASKLNLDVSFVDAPTDRFPSNEKEMQEYLWKFGELYHLFGCNSGIFEMYKNRNVVAPFHDFGIGINWVKACELSALPLFEEVFGVGETLPLSDVIKKIYIRPGAKETFPEYKTFEKLIEDEFLRVIEKEGGRVQKEALTRRNVSLLSMEYFKRASSINYVLANNYVYSFPVTATKEMYRIIADTDYQYREKNHLVADVLLELAKNHWVLTEIPFYSDIREMILDKEKKIMKEPRKNIYLKKLVGMKRFLIKGEFYEKLRKTYHNLTNKKQGDEADAINYWISPMEEYLNKSELYQKFNLREPLKNLHFNQFIDLFFMIWATEHFDIGEDNKDEIQEI